MWPLSIKEKVKLTVSITSGPFWYKNACWSVTETLKQEEQEGFNNDMKL